MREQLRQQRAEQRHAERVALRHERGGAGVVGQPLQRFQAEERLVLLVHYEEESCRLSQAVR
jgi:hypothetical protein